MLAQAFIGDTPSVAQTSGSGTMNMAIPPRPPNYDGPLPPPPPPPPAPQHLSRAVFERLEVGEEFTDWQWNLDIGYCLAKKPEYGCPKLSYGQESGREKT